MPNPIKIQAQVVLHEEIFDGVYKLQLLPEKKRFRFYPGQFLHLAIDSFDPNGGYWPDSRVFSIASSPQSELIEIVYSVKGIFTLRMAHEIQNGMNLWLKFPYGNFIMDNFIQENKPAVIIAGGTGISPFLSYFRGDSRVCTDQEIHLYWGVKNPKLFGLLENPEDLKGKGYILHYYSENSDFASTYDFQLGMIPIQTIFKSHNTDSSCLYFLSGPPRMIQEFKSFLRANEVSEQNIIIDDWE